MSQELRIPDLGDVAEVSVIEILVAVGDTVAEGDSILVLESDKATMDVPAEYGGTIEKMILSVGDKVSQGDPMAVVALNSPQQSQQKPQEDSVGGSVPDSPKAETTVESTPADAEYDCDVLVLGAGPGGYSAAFRAVDLGLSVILVERDEQLGGVCLNVGCIPSKALLHTARVVEEAAAMAEHGVQFGEPRIDLNKLRDFKNSVVAKLTGGLTQLAKQRKVRVVRGVGRFIGPNQIEVEGVETQAFHFRNAIIACGSEPFHLPGLPWDDKRLVDSTGALELPDIPKRMLVIGGGIIGLEMANVYSVLGAKVDVVEMMGSLIPGADADLVRVLRKRMDQRLENTWLNTRVSEIQAQKSALKVFFEGDTAPEPQKYDRVLVAIGRVANGGLINAEAAGVQLDEQKQIPVDVQLRTNVSHIFAIGDVTGPPQLAHRAVHQGKVAAEVIAGEKSAFEPRCIPSVVYTDPEVAWTGMTEAQAKDQGVKYELGNFPWAANGRSLGMANDVGHTKILFDAETERCIGAGAVGPNAGELIAELSLAIEMGADMHDIGLTIHPHPTLSETVGMAAEAAAGTLTDLYMPRKKPGR